MINEPDPKEIGSISSLPSFREMKQGLDAVRVFGALFNKKDVQKEADIIETEMNALSGLIDGYYELLGSRNWIFSDYLSLEKMETVIDSSTPEEAEKKLIDYFKEDEVLDTAIMRLNKFPDMRPRIPLLKKAKQDFLEGRYYSSVLVTISVMDGFVNDAFKEERKGLHARTEDEMHTDDCVATVFNGLPSVQGVFRKSFHKLNDEPIFDVYRNGIMHGMLTNYDNDVVASKAWCMLFAVCDWVESRRKEMEQPEPAKVNPFEVLNAYAENKRKRVDFDKHFEKWKKHDIDLDAPTEPDREVLESIKDYFESWCNKNYGGLARCFHDSSHAAIRKLAGEAREFYSEHPLNDYKIVEVVRPAPARAESIVKITSDNKSWTASICFVRQNDEGPVAEWEEGKWKVVHYATDPFRDTNEDAC